MRISFICLLFLAGPVLVAHADPTNVDFYVRQASHTGASIASFSLQDGAMPDLISGDGPIVDGNQDLYLTYYDVSVHRQVLLDGVVTQDYLASETVVFNPSESGIEVLGAYQNGVRDYVSVDCVCPIWSGDPEHPIFAGGGGDPITTDGIEADESYIAITPQTSPVPEPSTISMMGAGLVGIVGTMKRHLRR